MNSFSQRPEMRRMLAHESYEGTMQKKSVDLADRIKIAEMQITRSRTIWSSRDAGKSRKILTFSGKPKIHPHGQLSRIF